MSNFNDRMDGFKKVVDVVQDEYDNAVALAVKLTSFQDEGSKNTYNQESFMTLAKLKFLDVC